MKLLWLIIKLKLITFYITDRYYYYEYYNILIGIYDYHHLDKLAYILTIFCYLLVLLKT